jgi:serine phosphatase RsbU (regulator of sigma subunit)/uncharacterized membrane protein
VRKGAEPLFLFFKIQYFMAMDIPVQANLRFGRCLKEGFSVWASNIPIFFLGSFLAVTLSLLSLTLFTGSLYAGLSVMVLRALQHEKPRLRDLFGQIYRFIRFFSITIFILLFFIFGIAIVLVPIFLSSEKFADILNVVRHQIMQDNPGSITIDSEDIMRFITEKNIVMLAPVIAFVFMFLPGLVLVVKCFYMFLLAADRGLRLDEAYVESRKAVEKYGFWKHLFLILMALSILGVVDYVADRLSSESIVEGVVLVLFAPLSIGILASAYEQTLNEERRQWENYKRKFVEMRDELQTAHDMQMSLLPQAGPDLPGYLLHGICIPANSVGGDYYAYRWLDKNKTKLAIVVADVSGKAMEAAVVGLRFNDMLRYECQNRTEPAAILDGLNTSLEGQIDMATFITCCIAVLDVPSGQVHIANAGHCPPFLVGDKISTIDLTGYPLGLPKIVRPNEPYATQTITLNPGDRLVLYSDGVVEAQNARRQFYEEDRFIRQLKIAPFNTPPNKLIQRVVTDVTSFAGNAPRTDDITLVVLHREIFPKH